MPVSKRTGKRYARGSHSGFSPGESRVCAYGDRCLQDGRIVLSRDDGIWFHVNDVTREKWTVHTACFRALGAWYGYPAAPKERP